MARPVGGSGAGFIVGVCAVIIVCIGIVVIFIIVIVVVIVVPGITVRFGRNSDALDMVIGDFDRFAVGYQEHILIVALHDKAV